MHTKFNFPSDETKIVYVRPVLVADLPEELRSQAAGVETLYAVHTAAGAPLALVSNRRQAFALARENDLTALSVH